MRSPVILLPLSRAASSMRSIAATALEKLRQACGRVEGEGCLVGATVASHTVESVGAAGQDAQRDWLVSGATMC